MKNFIAALISVFICHCVSSQNAKPTTDCTVFFDVKVTGTDTTTEVAKTMQGTTKILYIKGLKSRSDLITRNFKQTTLTDSKLDSTIVLRELGSNKYISYLNNNKMREQNKKFEGIQFTNTNEKKTILGYECKKVVSKLANNAAYSVFYTPVILPANKEYEYQFRNLPGLVLEYEEESENGKTKIIYSATKISLSPVPSAKFDLPKAGYRIL